MTFIADNVRVLRQGIDLLRGIDPDLYAKPERVASSSGIGSHVRHILDYYERFVSGLESGSIDYDQRERDERLERERDRGVQRLEALVEELEGLRERDVSSDLSIKVDAVGDEDAPWSRSSFERELQFQLSHAVHHFALIAVILRLNGHEPGREFGVAPSTLRHWRESGMCAR